MPKQFQVNRYKTTAYLKLLAESEGGECHFPKRLNINDL